VSDNSAEKLSTSAAKQPAWWKWLDAIAVAAIVPSLLSGTARWWWVGDLCVHFRLYYAIALTLLAAVYLVLRRRRWLMAICLVLAVNLSLLWPLVAPHPLPQGTERSLTAMTANVFIGNRNARPLLEVVDTAKPDVLLLMEVDDRWLQDVAALQSVYPHRAMAIRDEGFGEYGAFGLALFSRQPLRDTQIHRLGTAQVPIIVTNVTLDAQTWTLIGAHPYPPVSAACSEARDTFLAELGQLVADLDGPKLLLGDLNVTRWSPHFTDLLSAGGLVDSQLGQGYQPTWPDVMGFPLIPIDHVLVSPEVVVLRREVGPSIASDHRPVIVDVGVRNSR
jgi:endonuclease/exonuclease/phosphatase (EEP) superfamily protein YafD